MATVRKLMVAAVMAIAVVGSTTTGTAQAAPALTLNQAVHRAAKYAASLHVHAAVAVIDTKTGRLYAAGHSTSLFPSASVVKVYMATYLLRTHKMTGYNKQVAWYMITRSSNTAFEYLLGKYFGGSASRLYYWMRNHYKFSRMGAPTPESWCWGGTRITARGITRLYQRILRDPKVRPWLMNAMSHYVPVVDGFNQAFGIPSASKRVAIKQGWSDGCSPVRPYRTVLNSTGFVKKGRYTIAILTESKGSINWQKKVISHMAKIILRAMVTG